MQYFEDTPIDYVQNGILDPGVSSLAEHMFKCIAASDDPEDAFEFLLEDLRVLCDRFEEVRKSYLAFDGSAD